MERIIKFRAWDLKKNQFFKEWFSISNIGDTIYDSDGFSCIIGKDVLIQQFTGLYDKTWREVYEGDILKTHYGSVYTVEYIQKLSLYTICRPKGVIASYPFIKDDAERCEVIGNIYENPELIND